MRFYDIAVTNTDGSTFAEWKSLSSDGVTPDPGALMVEVDIPLYTYDTPKGQGAVKIYGVGLPTISQSKQFAGKSIAVSLGMSKGLPLANPAQQGIPIKGTIYQGYGNWQGVNQSLDLIFNPAVGSASAPINLAFNWKAGQTLAAALASTLKAALPNLTQNINISSSLVLNHDEPGQYQTLSQFAGYVQQVSAQITGNNDPGVMMFISNGAINVYDSTNAALKTPKSIMFTDLIGQPTWIDIGTVQIHCVMRADIILGDIVTLPVAQQTYSAASNSQFQNSLSFNGKFLVSNVRLVGNSRASNAENWITVIDLKVMSGSS